tara:strand:+ start:9216 stop:9938 length:723 start_codon:yes stop_codon:yes gene_type:complete
MKCIVGLFLMTGSSVALATITTQIDIDLTGPLACSSSTSCTVDLTGNSITSIPDNPVNEFSDFNIDIVFGNQQYLEAAIGPGAFGGEFVFQLQYSIIPTGQINPDTVSGTGTGFLSDESGNNIRDFDNSANYSESSLQFPVIQQGPGTSIIFHDAHFTLSSVLLRDLGANNVGIPIYGGTFDPTALLISFSGQGDGSLEIGEREVNNTVPEPVTFLLMGIGLAGLGFVKRRHLRVVASNI